VKGNNQDWLGEVARFQAFSQRIAAQPRRPPNVTIPVRQALEGAAAGQDKPLQGQFSKEKMHFSTNYRYLS